MKLQNCGIAEGKTVNLKNRKRQASSLEIGESFLLPSSNGHDASGFRRYTVTEKTAEGVKLEDAHGYTSVLRFTSPDAGRVMKEAVFNAA